MTNNIDTSEFVLKTKYGTDKPDLEKEIGDTSGIVKKLDHNVKITEIENRTPTIIGLATTSALTAVENKISDVSSLVKKIIIIIIIIIIIRQELVKLKRNFLIMIMINILLPQNLII